MPWKEETQMTEREKAKKRLLKNLRRVVAEYEQIARDIAWWNEYRTDAPPMDNGGDLVVAHLGREMIACVEADRPIPRELNNRWIEQVEANAGKRRRDP